MPIKVAIVEDNQDILQALEQVLSLSDQLEHCGSFISGEEALEELPSSGCNVVLMDIHLGGMNGIEVVRRLKPICPEIQFMMCTIYEEDEKIFEALSAGASGYITKKTSPGKMIDAILELHNGGAPMSSQIARKVVSAFSSRPSVSASEETLELLSRREAEILEMLSKGLVYKEIADALNISSETVRKHVYNIYNKLHVSNRVEAVNRYFGR